MELEILKKILIKNIKVEGLIFDAIDMALEPALKKIVEDSSNPFDDMLLDKLYPILEEKMKEIIKEKLDEILK